MYDYSIPVRLLILRNLPTCTFIPSCAIIRYSRYLIGELVGTIKIDLSNENQPTSCDDIAGVAGNQFVVVSHSSIVLVIIVEID